jgi:hypothetical protein
MWWRSLPSSGGAAVWWEGRYGAGTSGVLANLNWCQREPCRIRDGLPGPREPEGRES